MHLRTRDIWVLVVAGVLLAIFAIGLWPLALPLAFIVLVFWLALALFNAARGQPPSHQA